MLSREIAFKNEQAQLPDSDGFETHRYEQGRRHLSRNSINCVQINMLVLA